VKQTGTARSRRGKNTSRSLSSFVPRRRAKPSKRKKSLAGGGPGALLGKQSMARGKGGNVRKNLSHKSRKKSWRTYHLALKSALRADLNLTKEEDGLGRGESR